MRLDYNSEGSAQGRESKDLEHACCATCDCYKTVLPSGAPAVMAYCALRMMPVDASSLCEKHPQYTGGVPA